MSHTKHLHVVLGAGQIGSRLARKLLQEGHKVRLISRSGRSQSSEHFEQVGGDITDLSFAEHATHGATVIYDCMNPPYHRWPDLLLPIATGALHGALKANAKLVALDCLYMYGQVTGPMHEMTPMMPCSKKGELRVELSELRMDAYRQGRVQVSIARASDFFGPALPYSCWNDRFFQRIFAGKSGECLGDPDMPHSYTYVEDIARGLATLGEDERANGEIFHLPTNPPQSTRLLAEQLGRALNLEAEVVRLNRYVISLASLVSPFMRELKEMSYQWEKPFVIDDHKFRSTFGYGATSIETMIADTARWANEKFGKTSRPNKLLARSPHAVGAQGFRGNRT